MFDDNVFPRPDERRPGDILDALARAVVDLDRDAVLREAGQAIVHGVPPETAITAGLAEGMRRVGEKYARKEYFVPEVLVAGRVLTAGMEILSPRVKRRPAALGTAVCAVVEGDFHDIGKNIVKLMVEVSGIRVVDLGKNVSADRLVAATLAEKADLVLLSTLMTPTLPRMERAVEAVREKTGATVLVGGPPVTSAFAARIRAFGTAPDAAGAVRLCHDALSRRTA